MNLSLKGNVIASYISQLYGTLVAIVMVPLYLRYMGGEAYGLVGFFAMLQMLFQLLDMGLTATITREAARFQGGKDDALALRRLLRALECIFLGVALFGALAMIAGADLIAGSWLKVQQLPLAEVRNAIMLMAVIVVLRWISGLYRGAITGFERFVWLGGLNVAVATTRFVLVIPFFIYVGATPTDFFTFQLAVAAVETTVLLWKTYRLLPKREAAYRLAWEWSSLHGVLKFSLSIAFTNSIWVMVTQTDKLLLSRLLPLTDYAYFTLAVLVASGIMMVSSPISSALLPRLTKLAAEGNDAALIRLYRNATQLVGVIAIPPALILAFFAEQVLWAWTGDAYIARKAAPVLALYALGNGVLALGAFPYYLQFAKGDLKLHLIGNALFVVLLIPVLGWTTWKYGIVGAGYGWLITNVIFFLFYVPAVHARFFNGLHLQWLLRDVSSVVLLAVLGTVMLDGLIKWPQQREAVAIGIIVAGLVVLAIAAAGSSWIRTAIGNRYRAQFAS